MYACLMRGALVPAGFTDNNPCTQDSCGEGGCQYIALDGNCTDDDFCTIADRCEGGECIGDHSFVKMGTVAQKLVHPARLSVRNQRESLLHSGGECLR